MEVLKVEDLQCGGCGEYKPISLFRSMGKLCEECKLIAYNLLRQPNSIRKEFSTNAENHQSTENYR